MTVGNSTNVREKRKSESFPLSPLVLPDILRPYNPRIFVSTRTQSHFRIFIDGQILLSLFLFFFPLSSPPLILFLSFVTRCPFAKRPASSRARSENLHVQMEKLGLPAAARIIMRRRGFASERRKALISRRNVDKEKEKRSGIFERCGHTEKKKTVDPGDECASGRQSRGHRCRDGRSTGEP